MEFIKVNHQYEKHVALIELNRPKELNALNRQLMLELRDALKVLDEDEKVRVIIITGNEKAFAAGADIKEMAGASAIDMLKVDQFSTWDQIKKTKLIRYVGTIWHFHYTEHWANYILDLLETNLRIY